MIYKKFIVGKSIRVCVAMYVRPLSVHPFFNTALYQIQNEYTCDDLGDDDAGFGRTATWGDHQIRMQDHCTEFLQKRSIPLSHSDIIYTWLVVYIF